MGGKVWSPEEEECFWTFIIPQSAKRLGVDRANPAKSWDQCRKLMQEKMKDKARRDYTDLGLFEHFFQNAVKKRFSPNATRWAQEYVRRAELEGGETLQNDHFPKRQKNNTPARGSPLKQPASTPNSQRTPRRPPNHELNGEEKGSPAMKAETSPQPSEVELPPFHPSRPAPRPPSGPAPDPFESPAPRGNTNNYPAVEDGTWDDDLSASSSVPRHYNSTPASRSHFSSSVPRSQDARLEARIQRTHDTPTRIRRKARSATPGTAMGPPGANPGGRIQSIIDLEDPFVDSNSPPVPRGNGGPSGYGGQAAYQNPAQYQMMGFPPHPGYYNFGQPPMTGTGQDFIQQSPANQYASPNFQGAGGRAPTANMSPPPHPNGSTSRPNSSGIFEGSPDHRVQYTGQNWQQIAARPYTPSFPDYHGSPQGSSPQGHSNGNGHGVRANQGTSYRNEEAGQDAGGYRPPSRSLGNTSGGGVYPGVYNNNQPQQARPVSNGPDYNGLPAVGGTDNQSANGSAHQSNSSNSSNASYPQHPAYGGQAVDQGNDANNPGSAHDNYQNGGENAHGHQYSVEGSPNQEQGNTANASHAENAGPTGQPISPFADPDTDADGEDYVQAEQPHHQSNNPAIHAPTPQPHRRIQLDDNYDDEVLEGTPF